MDLGEYKLRTKSLTKLAKDFVNVSVRDTFQTPAYAVDLLVPLLPKLKTIWECAVGGGMIAKVLNRAGYGVFTSGIGGDADFTDRNMNFITETLDPSELGLEMIITNPPFSIKKEFIEKAFEYGLPFAFLINADYSGEQIDWVVRGCEKIIPTRRINYLTPNILRRIHEGEIWMIEKEGRDISNLEEYKREQPSAWKVMLETYDWCHNYKALEEVPNELLARYSSSQFHSMWLTHGLNLGRTETFVDLSLKEIKENILCRQ